MTEQWKSILGYEGKYEISNLGRVKSLPRLKKGKSGSMQGVPGRILKAKMDDYFRICLSKDGIKKLHQVNVLVASAFIVNPAYKPIVNHIDGNKLNNSVENLEWVTRSENQFHAVRTGLQKSKKGEHHPFSRFTEKQIRDIRTKYIPRTYSMRALAEEYRVCVSSIQQILNRQTWKHVA
jgi:hypothetical protein